jgi:Tfp pilus assembly protein PilN
MRPINLLPPEIMAERSRRRRVVGYIGLAVLYVALLGVGVVLWNGRVEDARDRVAIQQEINLGLERQLAALGEVRDLADRYADRADLVRVALDADVDWGIILNDLARLLPARVWVETFSGTVVPGSTNGVLGQVSFTGVGFDFPDVSDWLRTLDSEDFVGITGSWVSTVTESGLGADTALVNFTSTAVLTDAAETNRAQQLVPEIP